MAPHEDISATSRGAFRFVELFAGIGGFRLALERLGGDTWALMSCTEGQKEKPLGSSIQGVLCFPGVAVVGLTKVWNLRFFALQKKVIHVPSSK